MNSIIRSMAEGMLSVDDAIFIESRADLKKMFDTAHAARWSPAGKTSREPGAPYEFKGRNGTKLHIHNDGRFQIRDRSGVSNSGSGAHDLRKLNLDAAGASIHPASFNPTSRVRKSFKAVG